MIELISFNMINIIELILLRHFIDESSVDINFTSKYRRLQTQFMLMRHYEDTSLRMKRVKLRSEIKQMANNYSEFVMKYHQLIR